jgi:hypothetical protein
MQVRGENREGLFQNLATRGGVWCDGAFATKGTRRGVFLSTTLPVDRKGPSDRVAPPPIREILGRQWLSGYLAEGVGSAGSIWRAERGQGDMRLTIADMDVARSGEQLMQQVRPS